MWEQFFKNDYANLWELGFKDSASDSDYMSETDVESESMDTDTARDDEDETRYGSGKGKYIENDKEISVCTYVVARFENQLVHTHTHAHT